MRWSGGAVRRGALALPLAALLPCCSARAWSGADEFVAALRCGMSEPQIAAAARGVRGLRLHRPAGRDELLVAQRGKTLIFLHFEGSGLRAAQVSWTRGLTRQAHGLKMDLCSGERLVELHLVGGSAHAGAAVWLDGRRAGALSSAGTLTLDVPLGRHRLRVETGRGEGWSAEVAYDDASSGYDRLIVDGG